MLYNKARSIESIELIYDSYMNEHEHEIFLCKTATFDQKWYKKEDLPPELLKAFIESKRGKLSSCNTDKTNCFACDMKTRTRGIQLA